MNTLKKRKSGKKGFTLMEMLIVVAIIGILVAIMIPTFSNALTKARISADVANLRSYYSDTMTKYMLGADSSSKTLSTYVTGVTLNGSGEATEQTTVTIDGVTYTLQAGKYDIAVDDTEGKLTITYNPTNSSKYNSVKIPGQAVTEK